MITVRYPNCIEKVGIEFEGFYSRGREYIDGQTSLDLIRHTHGEDIEIEQDESLRYMELDEALWVSYEIGTKPMNQEELNGVLSTFHRLQEGGLYRLNQSCGLHYHISVKENGFGQICTGDFYDAISSMFFRDFRKIYDKRRSNRYCSAYFNTNEEKQNHFRPQSPDRYHMVNYSRELSHLGNIETVEIRFYGGEDATIAGLALAIQKTLDIIDRFYQSRRRVATMRAEVERGEVRRKIALEPIGISEAHEPEPIWLYRERMKRIEFVVGREDKSPYYQEYIVAGAGDIASDIAVF